MSSLQLNLQVLLCLTYVTNAVLAAFLAGSGLSFRGAWLWVLAQVLLALGTVGDALPASTPQWIPLVAGNSCYALASLCYIHSIWVFRFRTRFSLLWYSVGLLQVLSFAWAYGQLYTYRAIIFSFWMALGPSLTAVSLLWRIERRFRLANTLTALPFLLLGMASVSRIYLLQHYTTRGQYMQIAEQNIWYTAGAILLSTITLFGYFMMSWLQTLQTLKAKDSEIESRNKRLQEANRTKDLFFAIIAHDIREPIGGAARYVRKHLIAKFRKNNGNSSDVETLASSLEKTQEYLDKLLWWSKTQLQDWCPDQDEIAALDCVNQALKLHASRCETKRISVRIEGDRSITLRTDPESVQLMLSNLVSNAIKYSRPGQAIQVMLDKDGAFCRIAIEDHGVGMDRETLGKLFRIESKLSALGTLSESGNGLGLILTKSLAERTGSRIQLDSRLGEGTRASLWIPLACTEAEA